MMNRRFFLTMLAAVAAVPAPAMAADHPSVVYVRQVAKDLLAAHRQGTTSAFLRVIQRHADIPEIAEYSLGKYLSKLQKAQRPRYQRAVATYMARFFALQSRDYTISKYEVGEATVDKNKDVIVKSRAFLVTGQNYGVSWQLVWRGGRYRVRDVKVLAWWLTPQQKGEFVAFLDRSNGDINRLIVALNG
jgi:phospholipid transport system substrate-binding protein